MTTIEEKRERFLAGQPLGGRVVGVAQAGQLGVRMHKAVAGELWCEPHARCASARPTPDRPLFIGHHSYVNEGGYLRGAIFVGRYCSIGRRVTIGAATHAIDAVSTSPAIGSGGEGYTDAERERLFGAARARIARPTLIDNDVWIGDGAVLLAGVHVGSGAVVGANAVVTHDVAPYRVVGGVPAKLLRARFPDDVADALLASRWWNRPRARLRGLPTANVLRFLEALAAEAAVDAAVPTLRLDTAAPG